MTGHERGSLHRAVARAAASLWLLTILPAIVVAALPGASHAARGLLAFALTPHEGSIGQLLGIVETNGRVVVALALAAWGRSRAAGLRLPADLLVGVIVSVNATFVGVAVGAYGARAVPWLVHLPIEWTALAVVVGLHRVARRGSLQTWVCALTTAAALALVGLGALVETYLTPQR